MFYFFAGQLSSLTAEDFTFRPVSIPNIKTLNVLASYRRNKYIFYNCYQINSYRFTNKNRYTLHRS